MRYVTIRIPVADWQRVDACVDNSMAIDAVDGLVETMMSGACVRDAGWRAAHLYPGERDAGGWPPREHILPLTLRTEHWEWVLSQLDRWSEFQDKPEVRANITAVLREGSS